MTPTQKLKAEVAHTDTILREASARLFGWATLVAGDTLSLIPPEEIRQVAAALAHQGGRLSMAHELTKRKAKS